MNSRKKKIQRRVSEEEIDRIVESEADTDSAWDKALQVRKGKPASLPIPADLAVRAAFLAKLHKERNTEDWLNRIIKERVELEEVAFTQAKREMLLKTGTQSR